ncbi:uncharacterized protein EDB93DRAFT_1108926 [Suillus bovinus]|uniref:uncharacterized protein n=1 Tax=Suillus bovinus TaxID=48563 RepID=UPI001B886789|nr:uncharacterized protein EDB93DRAFT_1108926 [Suillus bovinus]KAG2128637.1 hypothetical protein EDB93DRAFT_1108926 [Suillus bovinus]
MCNGLAYHVRDRALFLQCIGPSMILSIEYGAVVMECLTLQITQVSFREHMKMVRKGRKMQAVADKCNLDNVLFRNPQSPDIHDERGVQIHVSEYKTKLKEGSIVELEMMLQHMQLLPCEKYMQAAFINPIKDGKGKRKAADEASEAMSQSPIKKGSFSAVVGDKLEYMEE